VGSANQAARRQENEVRNELREVRSKVGGYGSTKGVADEGDAFGVQSSPWNGRGAENQVDLRSEELGILRVLEWVWGGGETAAEEVWGVLNWS
jgi:hypothetical protein